MKNLTLFSLIATLLLASATFGMTPEEKGLDVAKKIDSYDEGWINQTADVVMILKNQYGQESKREMHIKTLEDRDKSDDIGDKSLTVFRTPKDVKGTSFLSFTRSVGGDLQWLYMPALRRVKTIASDNKSGPFMGSEFAFEDISTQEVDKYTYKFIKNETVDGLEMAVIERYPVDKKSGYTKQVVWADTQAYRIYKIHYFDRKGDFLKRQTFTGYKKYFNNTWRADEMEIVNEISGKSTRLIWKNYAFNTPISEKDFNKNALKRLK